MTSPLEQCRDALRDILASVELTIGEDEVVEAALAAAEAALAAPTDIAAKLKDPVLVHAAMLRGEIAKPDIRDMLHAYGADALARWDAALAAQPEPVAWREQMRGALQQATLALEELDGPGYLIGGVMHHRIGLLLPMLHDAVNALNAAPVAAPVAQPLTELAQKYASQNPLGGPAKVFDACADAIRAGDPIEQAMANFGLAWAPKEPA